jgi:quercetin dioxygenase-like cupin family protein
MTLNVASGGYVLWRGEGEALWFSGDLLTYKATGEQSNGLLALAEVRAPIGTGSPPHRHHREDEAWYVIDGELTFWLGDTEHAAGAGSFVFGPRGVAHRFVVTSSEARFLILVTPAGFEHFTRVCGDPATARTFRRRTFRPKTPTRSSRQRECTGSRSSTRASTPPTSSPLSSPAPLADGLLAFGCSST